MRNDMVINSRASTSAKLKINNSFRLPIGRTAAGVHRGAKRNAPAIARADQSMYNIRFGAVSSLVSCAIYACDVCIMCDAYFLRIHKSLFTRLTTNMEKIMMPDQPNIESSPT